MKLQVDWSHHFLKIDSIGSLLRLVKGTPFDSGDIKSDWVNNPYTSLRTIKNTLALLSHLKILTTHKKDKYRLSKDKIPTSQAINGLLQQRLIDETHTEILASIPFASLFFDMPKQLYIFSRNSSPMQYTGMINFLVSLGMLSEEGAHYLAVRDKALLKLLVEKVQQSSRRKGVITPEALSELLDKKTRVGFVSEQHALAYEQTRLRNLGIKRSPEHVSLLDVSKGFDIASFESLGSSEFDRFIEVKTFQYGAFYISRNELQVAKALGNNYYLYLVSTDSDRGIIVEEVRNPHKQLENHELWGKEPMDFKITRF